MIAEDLVAAPANASGGAESPPRLLVIANPFAGSRPAARTQAALAGMLHRLNSPGIRVLTVLIFDIRPFLFGARPRWVQSR